MKPTDLVDVRVLDNFYQTSSYYPMPVVMVSTLDEQGKTNLGSYSLCFPISLGANMHDVDQPRHQQHRRAYS